MEPNQFAVVQSRFETIDPELLAETITANTRWPRADVQRLARKTHGILGTTFSEVEARGICRALEQAGFLARVVPAAKLMKLPRARSIAWLDVSDAALGVPLDAFQESATPVAWNAVFVIHAATIATLNETGEIVDVEPAGERGPVQEFQRDAFGLTQPTLGLVGMSAGSGMIHGRLSLQRFFRGRMPWLQGELSQEEQFRVVLGQLIAHSPQAVVSPAARRMVVTPLKQIRERTATSRILQDERAFQGEMNWLLQLLSFRES